MMFTPKAVLFDMNGVLVDDENLHEEAFRQVIENAGCSLSHDQYAAHFMGRTDQEGFISFLGKLTDNELLEYQHAKSEAYRTLAAGNLHPYRGVIDFVKAVHRSGVMMAVVTSSTKQEAFTVLETFGISNLFDVVIAADDVTKGKPDPEGYLKAAAELQAPPETCLVVEDAPAGVEAARRAGMTVLAVTNTHSADELGSDMVMPLDGDTWATLL